MSSACQGSLIQSRGYSDSASERTSNTATPDHFLLPPFNDPSHHPSNTGYRNGSEPAHGNTTKSHHHGFAWAGHLKFVDPTYINLLGLPGCDEIAFGNERPTNENQAIPFASNRNYPHPSSLAETWSPKLSPIAGSCIIQSTEISNKLSNLTAHGQHALTPVQGAPPITGLAPHHPLSAFESEDSDEDVKGRLDDSDYQEDKVPPSRPNADKTLPECYCPFEKTTTWSSLYDSNGIDVPATISARFRSKSRYNSSTNEPHYVIYRRNYFSNELSFALKPRTEATGRLYVNFEDVKYPVRALALRMSAVHADEDGHNVDISVFTAKRDRPIIPTPTLERRMQPDMPGWPYVYNESTGYGSNKEFLPTKYIPVHNQFRHATGLNGDRRVNQKYFQIVVELRALISPPSSKEIWVKVASTTSGLLVVRGRSPGSFPDDPNYGKRKARKVSVRGRKHQADRSLKKKEQSNRVSKKVGSKKSLGHIVSLTALPATASLTSASRSLASTALTKPLHLSPRDEIRKSLAHSTHDDRLVRPANPKLTMSALINNQRNGVSLKGAPAFAYGIVDPTMDFSLQLHQNETSVAQQSYVSMNRGALPFVQDHDDSNDSWPLARTYFEYDR